MSGDLTQLPAGWKPARFEPTPGPWRVGPTQAIPEGQQVLILAGPPGKPWGVCVVKIAGMADAGTQSANAALITAAPDLRQAAREMVDAFAVYADEEDAADDDPHSYGAIIRRARAALAKSDGM